MVFRRGNGLQFLHLKTGNISQNHIKHWSENKVKASR